jgi:hypothetical protein
MEQTNSAIVPKQGWSWGGFMFNGAFLIGVKRYKLLWWFILALVPLVNIVFWIVMIIYLGVNGHGIAAKGSQFANQSEYDGYIKGQDHAGKVVFFVFLVAAVIGIIAAIVAISLGVWGGGHMQQTMPSYGGQY